MVNALVASANGLDTEELSRQVELATTALPPVIRHVRASVELSGLNPDGAFKRKVIADKDGNPKSFYQLDPAIAEELKNLIK